MVLLLDSEAFSSLTEPALKAEMHPCSLLAFCKAFRSSADLFLQFIQALEHGTSN